MNPAAEPARRLTPQAIPGTIGRVGNLSLCICTMDRPDDLDRALRSVRSGRKQPYELIVSDDGAGTAREIAEAHNATYIQGPRRGLGANRNAAISAATGDLISFIDDDVIVPPEYVEIASSAPATAVTSGWEQNYGGARPRKVTPHNASFLGFQRVEPLEHYRSIVINATVFPSALFNTARFDEQIRYGYEEIDMAKHAVSLGWRIEYDDRLWVDHYPSPTNRDAYSSAMNVSRLYITHKSYRVYEKNRVKAAAFNLVAGTHHLLHAVKSGQKPSTALATLREARAKQLAIVGR